MSLGINLQAMLVPVRRRVWHQALAVAAPPCLAAILLGWRVGGTGAALFVLSGVLAGTLAWAQRRAAAYDERWLLRQLDARAPQLEDSADLLLADADALSPLQRLQQERVLKRLSGLALELRPAWTWRHIALAIAASAVMAGAAVLLPGRQRALITAPVEPVAVGAAVLQTPQIDVVAPPHTGQERRVIRALAVRAPAGSQLTWRLTFVPDAREVALVYLDGRRVRMVRARGGWQATARLDRSALYRLVVDNAAGQLNRLDAVPDQPPTIRIERPTDTVTVASTGLKRWTVVFEARDDFGVLPTARLRLVRSEGQGENVRFRESEQLLVGVGTSTRRRFVAELDLAALGIGPGTELVAQLAIRDNAPGGGQGASSPSVILRIPGTEAEAIGLEAAAQKAMPAYFRSQRQIIIDIETLLKARPRLSAAAFGERANTIGDDERILRMRYGRFLGEETEGQPKAPSLADLLTNDGNTGKPVPKTFVVPQGHDEFDGHDHGASSGAAKDPMAEFGHAHTDEDSEALFDPVTRAKLKRALDAMWRTERALRLGEAVIALPPAREALGLIKDIQQAGRVFLARTGTRLPPLDEGRRMSGKREGVDPATSALDPVPRADAPAAALFATLGARVPSAAELTAVQRWLGTAQVSDRLALLQALDAVRAEPLCAPCRARLRGALWGAMNRPAAQVPRRADAGAVGRRYLDAATKP